MLVLLLGCWTLLAKGFSISSPQNWHFLHQSFRFASSRHPSSCAPSFGHFIAATFAVCRRSVDMLCSLPGAPLLGDWHERVVLSYWIYMHLCLCVRQHSRSCRRTSPSNHVLSISAPSFKWPLVSLPYLWALNGFTAVHLTASPPAIFLMMPLSNVMTQDSA